MEAVFIYPQTISNNRANRLLGNLGISLDAITDDNFPHFIKIDQVPGWMIPSSLFDQGSPYPITTATGSAVPFDFITQERTEIAFCDFEFEQLAVAARERDERRFCEIVDAMNWDSRSPENFIIAIQYGLATGAYQKTLNLAKLGSEQYPDHTEIQKFAHILAPAKTKPNDQPPQPEGVKDIQWLKGHQHEYSGQWVALLRGDLLGVAPTLKELIRQVGSPKGTQILVTQVD